MRASTTKSAVILVSVLTMPLELLEGCRDILSVFRMPYTNTLSTLAEPPTAADRTAQQSCRGSRGVRRNHGEYRGHCRERHGRYGGLRRRESTGSGRLLTAGMDVWILRSILVTEDDIGVIIALDFRLLGGAGGLFGGCVFRLSSGFGLRLDFTTMCDPKQIRCLLVSHGNYLNG